MKPTISMLLLAVLLNSCASIPNLQKVEAKIPCLGAIGKDKTSVFKKEFQKIGEPTLKNPISVTVNAIPFTKNSYSLYKDYREHIGKETTVSYDDSNRIQPRYYAFKITDFVNLKSQLNKAENSELLEYLTNDKNLKVLTQISFVANIQEAIQIDEAEHLFVVEQDGMLALKTYNGNRNATISMSELQLFDFETAGFCWKNSTYGKPEIALIALDGKSCPKSTENNPEKLNDTKAYLKF